MTLKGNLKRTVLPNVEPVTLSEVKTYLRIDGTELDSILNMHITAAREAAEEYQNRAYLTQSFEYAFDCIPCMPLKLPRPPFVSLDSVKYYDTAGNELTFATSNFDIDTISEPGRIDLKYGVSFPATSLRDTNGVVISYTAGNDTTDAVPSKVKQAIMLYVAWFYERPDADEPPNAFYSLLRGSRVNPI